MYFVKCYLVSRPKFDKDFITYAIIYEALWTQTLWRGESIFFRSTCLQTVAADTIEKYICGTN